MELTDKIVDACQATFPMFGYEIDYLSDSSEINLNSAEEVNILIGLSNGLQGNIVISFSQETARNIISTMMGGMQIQQIDQMGKSALGEMANMIMGNAVSSIMLDKVIDISPPTIAMGKNMFIMISNIKARKLEFKISNSPMFVAYAIQ